MKSEEIPAAGIPLIDAAVAAELAALAAEQGARFAGATGEIYRATLILLSTAAKIKGLEASALLKALLRLLSAVDKAADAEASRIRAARAARHGKN